MSLVTKAPLVALAALLSFTPTAAHAQDGRFRASFGAAAAAISGDADLALNGSFGYRFSERVWFEADVTGLDSPADRFRILPAELPGGAQFSARVGNVMARGSQLFRGPGRTSFPGPAQVSSLAPSREEGSTLIGTLGLRYELPVEGDRFRPWVAGGLGLARTEEAFTWDPLWLPREPITEKVTHTGFAASAGLGASVRIFRQVSLDADARYFRLSRERNLLRLGGGVSVRF
ncbi:MAG: outer membrane beta-barrel protein [Acidobacteria bacterium]|nr:outer membrane beta-barrel protein [Acidobacteriota bacterium]